MLLEDFYDAAEMRASGIPDRDDWVEEIRLANAAASWWHVM